MIGRVIDERLLHHLSKNGDTGKTFLGSLAGAAIAFLGLVLTLINPRFNTIDDSISTANNRLLSIDNQLVEINRSLGRLEGRTELNPTPPSRSENSAGATDYPLQTPAPSVTELETFSGELIFYFYTDNSPYSSLSENNWIGAWVDVADMMADGLGFETVVFSKTPQNVEALMATTVDKPYVAAFVRNNDPVVAAAIERGWSAIALDPYFSPVGYGPFEYSVIVWSRAPLTQPQFFTSISTTLGGFEASFWQELAQQIENSQDP